MTAGFARGTLIFMLLLTATAGPLFRGRESSVKAVQEDVRTEKGEKKCDDHSCGSKRKCCTKFYVAFPSGTCLHCSEHAARAELTGQ